MAGQEIFYDSLEDEKEIKFKHSKSPRVKKKKKKSAQLLVKSEDVTKILPLYREEVLKDRVLTNKDQKDFRNHKNKKDLPAMNKKESNKKTYLSMYYRKLSGKNNDNGLGSFISSARAECDSLKEELASENDSEISSDDSECFYKNIIENESRVCQNYHEMPLMREFDEQSELRRALEKITLRIPSPSISKRTEIVDTYITKLESLKKRQNYGKIVSLKNRITMEECKVLTRIKDLKNSYYSLRNVIPMDSPFFL